MKQPSVIFLNRVYPPQRGATGRVLQDLAQAMERDGWNVTIICADQECQIDQDGSINVIRVKAPVKSKTFMRYMIVWLKIFMKAMRQPKPDLLVTMTDPPLIVVAGDIFARFKKCSHIHWCHDLFPDVLPALGWHVPDVVMNVLTKSGRRAMKRCDRVIAVGRCMAKYISQQGIEKTKISVVTNWPDHELLYMEDDPETTSETKNDAKDKIKAEAAPRDETDMLASAKIKKRYRPFDQQRKDQTEHRFRVLYSGNLGRAHPVSTILDAAELLYETYPDIEFLFVGEGDLYERLAIERAKRELDNIRLLPWQPADKLRAMMESGDLHLVSMQQEASGLLVPCKFYSAMAVGRPCIFLGPDESEVAQVLKDFHAGMVVPQGDVERLVSAIKTFRDSSDDWFSAHEGACEAGQVFVPDHSIKAWIKRAETVLEEAKQREFAA